MFASASGDGQVCLWNDKTETLTTLKNPVNHNNQGRGMCISPSGRYLAYSFTSNPTGRWLEETVVYDIHEGTECLRLKGHYFPVFLPDDVLITTVFREIKKPQRKEEYLLEMRKLGGNDKPEKLFSSHPKIFSVAGSADGRKVAVGNSENLYIISLPDKQVVKELGQSFRHMRSLEFSSDNRYLIAANESRMISTIDIKKGKLVRASKGGRYAITPDASLLIVGKEAVELWDPFTHKVKASLQLIPWNDKPEWIAFTPKGHFKRSAGVGKFLKYWKNDRYIKFDASTVKFLKYYNNDRYVSFESYAKPYERPELVMRALSLKRSNTENHGGKEGDVLSDDGYIEVTATGQVRKLNWGDDEFMILPICTGEKAGNGWIYSRNGLSGPEWSPDSKWIAFTRQISKYMKKYKCRHGKDELWIISGDGSGLKKIAEGSKLFWQKPDVLAYKYYTKENGKTTGHFALINIKTGEVTRLQERPKAPKIQFMRNDKTDPISDTQISSFYMTDQGRKDIQKQARERGFNLNHFNIRRGIVLFCRSYMGSVGGYKQDVLQLTSQDITEAKVIVKNATAPSMSYDGKNILFIRNGELWIKRFTEEKRSGGHRE
jgi:WD40 repeat protein